MISETFTLNYTELTHYFEMHEVKLLDLGI